ncbi:MAG: hypothetical protein NTZ26_11435 [Candidatus Aminicenantes bacterium]|jgi:hypothetical protein|nr:hypothetical protein [Candidatus Aminicenantes bacterium]
MPTFLKVLLIVIGVLAAGIGLLVWIFFHQGGCCIRKAKARLTHKDYVAPVLKQG